jgi:hypothetical protein
MALLRMLNRAAFICNISFLIAVCILWFKPPVNPGLSSLLIVMGFFLSVVLNFVVNGWFLLLRISKKPVDSIPKKLIYLNGGFLVIQLILLMK